MEKSSSDYQTKEIICSTLEILDILFVHKLKSCCIGQDFEPGKF